MIENARRRRVYAIEMISMIAARADVGAVIIAVLSRGGFTIDALAHVLCAIH
jgi:hypothetical protein